MPVYTETKTYRTKAHMGMIDVTDDFRAAVQNACRKTDHKRFRVEYSRNISL